MKTNNQHDVDRRPFIVGVGGTATAGSSTEQALKLALKAAQSAGAKIQLFGGEFLAQLPHYLTPASVGCPAGQQLIEAIRNADGIILASPGYHGTISGLVKNAIDYVEETAKDSRAYFDGIPVGLIATAYGWQATTSTIATLRSIVHALRGWPTPLGAAINTSGGIFREGACSDAAASRQLELVGQQVAELAHLRLSAPQLLQAVSN
ncbi:NADPH-dependent FMN reductase [Pseudomonas sp. Z18(2022)]|uniref:NADPH-dependent FMN reductase n=1 Tax=Pseudomonas sp. Z18(2022) TaxID=2983410 RepID=UPI002E7FCF2F|nr:NAD(P)H-dependent oxidoreductase [Pseudomonas sp. Z18(2022)]